VRVTLLFSRQLIIQGYRGHRLGASRRGLRGGGGDLGIPLGSEWVWGGERPEALEGGFEVTPQLERVQALIERVKLLAFTGGEDAGGPRSCTMNLS
jgi:hypothetical protein